jgi:hypothetical protein
VLTRYLNHDLVGFRCWMKTTCTNNNNNMNPSPPSNNNNMNPSPPSAVLPGKYVAKHEGDSSKNTTSCVNLQEERNVLAKNETQNVKRVHAIVAIALVLSTVGIALAIYFYVRRLERSDFEIGYTSDADRILDGIGMSIHDSLGAMAAFGSMMASFARQTNQNFSFFTMPKFAAMA